ncbi:FMN reductase [NAD(P)H] (plasmid) [Sulfitobacter sp. THAF37]|uniref:nitroreductase family protein n=1 Tax=Sulfitobacter sp. THAF37 TaxID=2587855 RepID=UPI0012697B08|nr:nitroreductase family protein [Sulfitobacter sp. THAF37]QFT60885.1 FMN reductase [NAD(P)H] [Sulfitobacter sp. THAF37]
MSDRLSTLLAARFSDAPQAPEDLERVASLRAIAGRGSCRSFEPDPIPRDTLRTLGAIALASPSKSDLQQRDIVIVDDAEQKTRLLDLVADQAWTAGVPSLVVFCANNRRQRHLHDMQGLDFANDHLDAFFNASVDAGIALASFVIAAEAAGLGCCPISTIRNRAAEASDILGLPDYVFPVAALAIGRPAAAPPISPRLPLRATLHLDRFNETTVEDIAAYDADRAAVQPYSKQRRTDLYGSSENYTWSMDKARQYSLPERTDFARFIRGKGFRLD